MPDPTPTPPAPVPVVATGPLGWSLAFWNMLIGAVQATIVSIVLGIASYVITGKLDDNTKQLKENKETQSQHAETQIAKQNEQIAAVKENTEATQAIPVAAAEAAVKVADKVIEEKKAADPKPEPPGLE